MYKNSGRANGTLRFFREKLQRRNVTSDVKHFEECVGGAYTVVALLHVFGMETLDDLPHQHCPPCDALHGDKDKKAYFDSVLHEFVSEYLIPSKQISQSECDELNEDQALNLVREYSLCLMRLFFILADFKRAVKIGNSDQLASLHEILLKHFKSDGGYNSYAIEMLISILENEVFLTEAQAHQTRWASTANFKGGQNNLEIHLLQENINCELKKGIKGMGANKTSKEIKRLSMAAGGIMEIVNRFDLAMGIKAKSSLHSHKSLLKNENTIISDLLRVKPFETIDGQTT